MQHRSSRQMDAHTLPHKQPSRAVPHEPHTLLRLPSNTSLARPPSPRSRRATNPSTPSLTHVSASSAASPAYFSPHTAASLSGYGTEHSRGPPIALITRGNSDLARRMSQQASDFAFAQQQSTQLDLLSPATASRNPSRDPSRERESQSQSRPQTRTRSFSPESTGTARQQPMARSRESSYDPYASAMRSQAGPPPAVGGRRRATHTAGTEAAQEDLFLNIAADSTARGAAMDAAARVDRLKVSVAVLGRRDQQHADPSQSRIARASHRQSPSASQISPAQPYSASTTAIPTATNGSRLPAAIDTQAATRRRASLLPSTRTAREQPPLTPNNPTVPSLSQSQNLSPKTSFSSHKKDSDLSPKEFLAQLDAGKRRPSQSEANATPPSRAPTFRPSNLHYYSSSRDHPQAPVVSTPQQEAAPRLEGTVSQGSTGPATSVWDELDELKTRIRRIELGGKIPATASAVISQATAERPRTANTSATTVSSSPNQQRKPAASPAESTVGVHTPNKIHPLLGDALAKAKQHVTPAIFRVLDATATEALGLAEMTGSAGPQGTLQSASSILNGASITDRQFRRKADNVCRSLTELCIALCENKPTPAFAFRSAITPSRRSSVQVNGDSPTIRPSIETENLAQSQASPSVAMNRIEARRVSMLAGGAHGSSREPSQEPPTPSQLHYPSRLSRASTNLNRARQTVEDEDEEGTLTLRAPSRAFTDFHNIRKTATPKPRLNREYISREPMPGLQPSALQHTSSLRRPTTFTGHGLSNDTNLLFRGGSSRYNNGDRQDHPTYEKEASVEPSPRTQYFTNRSSIGGISGLNRSNTLNRRVRGPSAGE
jgi:hypothetical protein